MPPVMKAEEPKNPAVQQKPPAGDSSVQPLNGTFSWDNVKISGEFKDGTGTLTITFH